MDPIFILGLLSFADAHRDRRLPDLKVGDAVEVTNPYHEENAGLAGVVSEVLDVPFPSFTPIFVTDSRTGVPVALMDVEVERR